MKRRLPALCGALLASMSTGGVFATVAPWTPEIISSAQFESHPAFDPLTGDLYFVRSARDFTGWYLRRSACSQAGWRAPEAPVFAAPGLEADPAFSRDGRTLYFISNRSTDGVHRADLDIWLVRRNRSGTWGVPSRLPAPVNSTANEWFPRPAPDGWLYFGSGRAGGAGKTDIWRAREATRGKWVVENVGPGVNSAGDEFEATPSSDGQRLLIMTSGGLFESHRDARELWGKRIRMGAEINLNGTEVGALLSPSGHSLLFARDTQGPLSGELFLYNDGTSEPWPPSCPASGGPAGIAIEPKG